MKSIPSSSLETIPRNHEADTRHTQIKQPGHDTCEPYASTALQYVVVDTRDLPAGHDILSSLQYSRHALVVSGLRLP